jgi:hypothetical protein
LGVVLAVQPAAAEGFFSKLFGWGGSRPVEPRVPPPTYNFGYGSEQAPPPQYGYGGYSRGYGYGGWGAPDNTRYRSLCVRTCDGFYFPIGDNVTRERLYADARTCMSRCDGEAQLYYYPTRGGSPETMVDLSGRPYAQTQTAFLYRKRLVEGCTCRAKPWSAEAQARHDGYAAEEREVAAMRDGRHYADGQQRDEIDAYLMREGQGYAQQQSPWDNTHRY